MLVGPLFTREVVTIPRGWRLYFSRAIYVAALFGLIATGRMILSSPPAGLSLSDLARFGSAVFAVLAPLQLAMAIAFSALLTAAAVAQEKDRRTFDLLLMTKLTNSELVLGKLLSSILGVMILILAAIPLLMLLALLGGISYGQIARVVGVTLTGAILAGSLGSTMALWRETTLQALSLSALALVLWLIAGELIAAGILPEQWLSLTNQQLAIGVSPLRAILAVLNPLAASDTQLPGIGSPVNLFMLSSTGAAVVMNLWSIARVRVWNPSREIQQHSRTAELQDSPNAVPDAADIPATDIHADPAKTRQVWDNPILWREICTWAYGKKVVLVRIAYLVVFAICSAMLVAQLGHLDQAVATFSLFPPAAKPLLPLAILGLVLVNSFAVTSITSERDLKALDLLLVTDLTPKEIIYGKLAGIFYNSKEMIFLPMVLVGALWWTEHLSTENLVFLCIVQLVMNAFVAMLGVHAGMTYANSSMAVAVSLGTVLFLLLGIAVCMRMMVAFQASFSYQLQAFAAFMLGGGIGLYVALGSRNRSQAIGWASFVAPFATFMVITNFLQRSYGAAFLVIVATYGFAIAAMLIPAIDEFDVTTGRTTSKDI